MRRPFWRTLAWKLTLAFALVGAVALGSVGVISGLSTRAEFNRFIGDQAREDLALRVQTYVAAHGSLDGFAPRGRDGEGRGPLGSAGPDAPGDPGGRGVRGGPRGGSMGGGPGGGYVALDPQYRTVFATAEDPRGTRLSGPRAAQATPVTLDGRVVAYVAPTGDAPALDPRSQEFLARTSNAIAWAMLGATLTAVLLGLLMSRALLGPLRDLRRGIRAVGRGEAPEAAPRPRGDELGEVLVAFHEMHDRVVRHQRARRQLTANIAHDLNTPLAVIGGTLEALLDGTFQPTPERLTRLHRETRHMSGLVSDLRFLSLADAGELQLSRRPEDVARVAGDTVDGVRELAQRRDVRLDFRAPDAAVEADIDAARVTQVLQNLLGNALRFTPAGGRIDVAVSRAPGGAARVRVEDTGEGIAADRLPFVFDRLYRADESRSGEGSGLGLAICRSIVEAHGGRIGIESAPGRGTAVTFDLPAAPAGTPRAAGGTVGA